MIRKLIALPFGLILVPTYALWLIIRFGLNDAEEIISKEIELLKIYKAKHN